jgi:hypothetical protein
MACTKNAYFTGWKIALILIKMLGKPSHSSRKSDHYYVNSLLICCVIAILVVQPASLVALWTEKYDAYGDGLAQEQISSSLGNRKADLLIKMTPSVVTNETLQKGQNPLMEFRLSDSNTNQSFSHVTYYITIEKNGKVLLSNWFHTHDGNLVLKIRPNPQNNTSTSSSSNSTDNTSTKPSKVSIQGKQEPLIGSYIGTVKNPAIVIGPVFSNSGLYHFKVRIATVDSDTGVLPADQQRTYDSWFSVGNAIYRRIHMDGKELPIKLVSYYDKLTDFSFDNKNMKMQFDMLFDWNISRIKKTGIFVHEEIFVPKPDVFTANNSLSATVNGIDISKDIVVDPTQPDKDVIHFMLPKDKIIQIADQVNNKGESSGLMRFALQPGNNNTVTLSSSMGNMSMPT